ncbi:Regulating synaptic membrane exocytosis protein 2 [Araneus ventricosus]|uniref:Regulating synaptic membrane exocytosis protein 2 n=1 Tax=Araneus ventricosus TaxID=182803 RepID=A0A4Y2BWF0_ARAVE|nr:Regulating synaptic membrane exocytosis protein 2 [Araneus ventricosus]
MIPTQNIAALCGSGMMFSDMGFRVLEKLSHSDYSHHSFTSDYSHHPFASDCSQHPFASDYSHHPFTSDYSQHPFTSDYNHHLFTSDYSHHPKKLDFSVIILDAIDLSICNYDDATPCIQPCVSCLMSTYFAEPVANSLGGHRWGSRLPPEVGEASSFVEGLGPGQLVGRQALASPSLGEVQLGINEKRNCLEVEVIRARGLMSKNPKVLPAPYVKVYLLDGRKCLAKQKTSLARRTLEPLYQEILTFSDVEFRHCYLQVTVWGNYSSMERKVFMGVVQIVLDDIDTVKGVIAWYRLFHHSSLVSSLTANDRSSFLSLDSFG